MLTYALGLSQRGWLADAVNLVSQLNLVLQLLDNAVNRLDDTVTLSPAEAHGTRPTYLLVSSCKLFCMTARARIYMETSKLPILPKVQVAKFQNLAMESLQDFFQTHKTFDQEGDLRYLDYFVVVSRSNNFFTPRSSMALTVLTAMLALHPRPPPGPLPRRPRFVHTHGGLSTNYPFGRHIESYPRG
jgi:hypothetical protein